MMSNFNWCFDAAAGVLLVLFLVHGIRKGTARTLIPFVVNLVFVVLSFFMSGIIASTLYEAMISDSVSLSVEEAVDNFDLNGYFNKEYKELTLIEEVSEDEAERVLSSQTDMDKKFWKLIDSTSGVGNQVNESACFTGLNNIIRVSLQNEIAKKLPPCSGHFFEKFNEANEEETYKLISMIYSDRKSAARYITENCVSDVMFSFVKLMSFVIASAVLMILTSIIFSIAFRNKDQDAMGAGDSAAGAVVEILNGLMVIVILAVLVKIIIWSGISIENIMDEKNT
ncbi:hypothetical protein [Ruminococcus sp. HUN007]|uniref:hypothetical protein n=1 Tax=Ruminococcus sp. HUN007 TaxID=1514668 RepID=UPI0005D16DDF|nr:hypothetical protein [Ruminococcus sp. HUN007]